MYIRIKELRQKNNISENEIAEFLKISVSLYKKFETGKKDFPVDILSKLAKKYNTSIDYLVGNTDSHIPHPKINS